MKIQRFILSICLLLSGCVSELKIVDRFVDEALLSEAKADLEQGDWRFDIAHAEEEFSYSFVGSFSEKSFNYRTCLEFPPEDGWKVLKISHMEKWSRSFSDLVAAYRLSGAYLVIYVPRPICDHTFEILKTKVLAEEIVGYQTFDSSFWGSKSVAGKVVARKVGLP